MADHRIRRAVVFTPHTIIGFISLALMTLHFYWAVIVHHSQQNAGAMQFHRFSLFVWSDWILSYITGFLTGMQKFV